MGDDPPEGHLHAGTRLNLRVAGQYESGLMILKRKTGLNNCSEPLNLALPHLPCSGTGASGSVQHPLAEPIQLRAAIARPLQEFQFRDLAFDLPVTVRQDEGTLYGGSLTL
jgi:hypothetical protein